MANVFNQVRQPGHAERVWGYAGFWWRVLAWLIDSLILGAAGIVIQLAFGHSGVAPSGDGRIWHAGSMIPISLAPVVTMHVSRSVTGGWLITMVGFVLQGAYFTLLESSRWQATLGKRACGLRVARLDGGRISLARAIGRYFAKFLSALILCIGFLMIAWTRRKQGLHDILAETLVIRLRPPSDLARFNPPA